MKPSEILLHEYKTMWKMIRNGINYPYLSFKNITFEMYSLTTIH